MKYEATYVVLADTAIGELKVASCHPLAVPPVNVTWPSRVPVEVHRLPTWVPVAWLGR